MKILSFYLLINLYTITFTRRRYRRLKHHHGTLQKFNAYNSGKNTGSGFGSGYGSGMDDYNITSNNKQYIREYKKLPSLQKQGYKRHFLKHRHHYKNKILEDTIESPRRRHHKHFPSEEKMFYTEDPEKPSSHVRSMANDLHCCNENVVSCCVPVEESHHYDNIIPVDMGPHLTSAGIQTESTDFYHHPKHMYENTIVHSEDGTENGGFLQSGPEHMHVPGVNVISHTPVHIKESFTTTSHETSVEKGPVHEHVCLNGGIFFPINDKGYQCVCPESKIGKNCGETNHCFPNPCHHGGHCHNTKEEPYYICSCTIGFYGKTCEQKDPCYPNPCKNSGECTHDGVVFSCICPAKFRGPKCEELNHCNPNPCGNGGTCVEEKGEGKFRCECPSPWRGTICEERSYCAINPCLNGGTCRETDTHFECECVTGFSGPTCNDRICDPNPCLNGGTCVEDGSKFRCVCLPWTSGHLCEENRPCLTKPCLHDGKCIDAFSGFHWSFGPLQYYCVCKPPYKGMNCERHACKNCHKNAHCVVDHCVCDDGYEGNGENCKKIENPCHPNPCLNGGTCTEAADYCTGNYCGFKCSCVKPYMPPICKEKHPCDPDPCVNGVCIVSRDSFMCQCDEGFRGKFCSDKDACHPNPCQHHGTCLSKNGTASCTCSGEWLPPFCKECGCPKSVLVGVPHMTCDPAGVCVCPRGYIADTKVGICKKESDTSHPPCYSNPCTNGGTCVDVSDTQYKCVCPFGYTGKECQYKTACNPNPCMNGGTCHEKDGKFISCSCLPNFSPPFCMNQVFHPPAVAPPATINGVSPPVTPSPPDVIPPPTTSIGNSQFCNPNPCKHEGICIPNHGSYDCICAPRYTGPHCDVDRCAHCHKDAKCVLGRCKCNPGFIGNGFNCERDTCEMLCVEWSTCVDGQCLCNPGFQKENGKCQPTTMNAVIQQIPVVLQPTNGYTTKTPEITSAIVSQATDAGRYIDTTTDNPEIATTQKPLQVTKRKQSPVNKFTTTDNLPSTPKPPKKSRPKPPSTLSSSPQPPTHPTLPNTPLTLGPPGLVKQSKTTAPPAPPLAARGSPFESPPRENVVDCLVAPPGVPCRQRYVEGPNNPPFDYEQALEDEADDLGNDYNYAPAYPPVVRSSLFSSLTFKLPPTNPHPHD